MILQAEAGTERFAQWARRKARAVDALRREMRVFALSKFFVPEPGVLVWIKATEAGILVRITGGIEGQISRFIDTSGGYSSGPLGLYPRAWRMPDKHAEFDIENGRGEAIQPIELSYADAGTAIVTRWNVDTPVRVQASRKNRAPAEISTTLPSGLATAGVSEDGRTVLAVYGSTAEEHRVGIFAVGPADDTPAGDPTTLAAVSLEFPQWALDFYAGLGFSHNLDTRGAAAFNVSVSLPMSDAPIFLASSATDDVAYDRLLDRPVVLFRMPFLSYFDPTPRTTGAGTRYEGHVGWHYELRAWDGSAWQQLYSVTHDYVTQVSLTLTPGSPDTPTSDPFGPPPDSSLAPTGPVVRLPGGHVAAAYGEVPTVFKVNGVVVATDDIGVDSATPFSYGTEGGLLVDYRDAVTGNPRWRWYGSWGATDIPRGLNYPSPNGRQLVSSDFSATFEFYKDGALTQTVPVAPPGPPEGPVGGFRAITETTLPPVWRQDKEAFKVEVYTQGAKKKYVDLQWDATLGGLKVSKTYSDVVFNVSSHIDGAAAPQHVTEAQLTQKYLLPHKVVE